MARRGLFPFPACVFWGLSDLTQARRGHPAACRALLYPTFAASPVPISSGSPSPAEQARPTFWGPPCSQWALETASAGEQWPSAIPMPMLGRTLGAPSPPTHGPEHPSPGGLCRLSVPTSRPRQSVPAREKPPSLPQPSSPRASLPCPRQERGATFHGICISPGERGPQACGRSPQAECPGPPSWVPSSGSSLDTTE